MKKILSVLIVLSILLACGAVSGEETVTDSPVPPSADVEPLPIDPAALDYENGVFCANVEDIDHLDEGWFTLALYEVDQYDPDRIRNLKPGTTLLVNGQVWTVTNEVEPRDIGWFDEEHLIWEIDTAEECWGGLWFRQYGEDTFAAYLDDWIPCTLVRRVRVTLPLPEGFEFVVYPGGEDPVTYGADEFLARLREDWGTYNQYNSDASFNNGEFIRLSVSGYPHGPDTDGPDDDDDC